MFMSPDIVRMQELKMRRVCGSIRYRDHEIWVPINNRILIGKVEGVRTCGNPRHRWEE
jgi:hypothetical protein